MQHHTRVWNRQTIQQLLGASRRVLELEFNHKPPKFDIDFLGIPQHELGEFTFFRADYHVVKASWLMGKQQVPSDFPAAGQMLLLMTGRLKRDSSAGLRQPGMVFVLYPQQVCEALRQMKWSQLPCPFHWVPLTTTLCCSRSPCWQLPGS